MSRRPTRKLSICEAEGTRPRKNSFSFVFFSKNNNFGKIKKMAVILQKKVENVRYLFGSPETSQSRYSQIKRTFFDNKLYELFTEPIYSAPTNTIMWSTELLGTAVSYNKLSPTDQSIAQKLLTSNIDKILSSAKQYNDNTLIEFIYQCIEIPSMDNVFLIRTKEGDKVVITQWGFISDVAGDEKGLLAKIIAIKRTDVIFNIVYDDNKNEAAPNQLFFFEYEGQTVSKLSDAEGKILLNDVIVDEQIKSYRKEQDKIVGEQSFFCYENGKYVLSVPRLVDMTFKVINQFEKPVGGIVFSFESNGQTSTLTSDTEGKIILPKQKFNEPVLAYQTKDDQKINEQSFICPKDSTQINYLKIVEEQPVVDTPPPPPPPPVEEEKKYQMKVKVVDKDNVIVPNALVTLEYSNKVVQKTTDENGFVYLEDVKPNIQVKIKAILKENN